MAIASRIALGVDGTAASFPSLDQVAGWLRALGLHAWVPGCSFAPPDAAAVLQTLSGVATLAVRHPFAQGSALPNGPREGSLLDSTEAGRVNALAALTASAQHARTLRAPWVLLEFGACSEEHLAFDRACRGLHQVLTQVPEVGLGLLTPRTRGEVLTPTMLAHIFDDLGGKRRLGYWHDAGRAHALSRAGGVAQEQWLSLHAARCIGVDATDAIGTDAGLPAGVGEVDFGALREAVKAGTPFVLRTEPFSGPGPLAAALSHLTGHSRAARP